MAATQESVKAKTKKAPAKKKKATAAPAGKRVDAEGNEKELTIEMSPEMDARIQDAMQTIDKLVGQRKIINAKVKAVYDDLEAAGIHREEVKLVVKLAACDEQQRKFRDQSRRIIRKALNVPDEIEKQIGLFAGDQVLQ